MSVSARYRHDQNVMTARPDGLIEAHEPVLLPVMAPRLQADCEPDGRITLALWGAGTLGRVNFGPFLADRKGITRRVELAGMTLMNWEIFPIPLDRFLSSLRFTTGGGAPVGPAFFRTQFNLTEIGDTFLDMRAWGKGMVWVNGHNLGRFWSIGPQQTLFCPGCWLRAGRNEMIVFDMDAIGPQMLAGLTEPILNEVRDTENS